MDLKKHEEVKVKALKKSLEVAHKAAWTAVKQKYKKQDDEW
jgi:cation transport regulator ChaB